MHQTLARQIRKTIGTTTPLPPGFQALLDLIDASYRNFEEDRALIERSLDISSRELLQKNQELQERLKQIEHSNVMISELEKGSEALQESKSAMLNLLEDIQEEKNTSEAYARELAKFKIALDGTSDHVIITNPDGFILYANASIERITGFTPKEVIGKKAGTRFLWGGLMDKSFYANLWKTIKEDKKPFAGEITNRRKDGTEYQALSSISPILNEAGEVEYLVGIERDITKEKEVDRAKTEFVSLASHQLRTPLTLINWYVEMLQAGDAGVLSDTQKEFLAEVYKGSRRMVGLVNDLLNISRLETARLKIEPMPTDLGTFIRETVKEVDPIARMKGCRMELAIAPSGDMVNIDPLLMREVLVNLLTNAIRYSSHEGNGVVTVSWEKTAENYVIQVKDNGIGIPPDARAHVFEKFYRADNARKLESDGNGLGLYLAKNIMESSGGSIDFTSQENNGTIFFVSIPLSGMKAKSGEKGLEHEKKY